MQSCWMIANQFAQISFLHEFHCDSEFPFFLIAIPSQHPHLYSPMNFIFFKRVGGITKWGEWRLVIVFISAWKSSNRSTRLMATNCFRISAKWTVEFNEHVESLSKEDAYRSQKILIQGDWMVGVRWIPNRARELDLRSCSLQLMLWKDRENEGVSATLPPSFSHSFAKSKTESLANYSIAKSMLLPGEDRKTNNSWWWQRMPARLNLWSHWEGVAALLSNWKINSTATSGGGG